MEPSVESKDKEERIKARRARIQARIEAQQAGDDDNSLGAGKDAERKDVRKGKLQVMESKSRLVKLKDEADEIVTSVRVEGDEIENSRRVASELSRAERRKKLLLEAEQSAKRNAAIAMKWAALFEKEVPMELVEEMRAQKRACDNIISAKDDLIREFQADLKGKDEEYVRSLKKQAQDVDTLLQHMTEQFYELHHNFEMELEEIENRFAEERKDLLDSNKTETDNLFEKRRAMEQRHMEERQARVEAQQTRLEKLRLHDSEDFTNLKVRLETEIQNLEQQLEEMRATYQLNTEKLEYNYRVLTERDLENSNTINQQKRKLARLQDVLSALMGKYSKTDKQYRQANGELTDEYRRITEQFKDLQLKFRHFEGLDQKRFEEIFDMKEAETKELVGAVLQADKLIHEQQLGLYWFPPNEEALEKSFEDGRRRQMQAGKRKAEGAQETSTQPLSQQMSERVQEVLSMVVDEAGFLLDSKIDTLVQGLSEGDGKSVKIDAVLKALGVATQDDVERLMEYLVVETADGDEAVVSPDDAVRAVRAFLQDQGDGARALAAPVGGDDDDRRVGAREQKDVWDIAGNVVPTQTVRIWKGLERMLQKYNGVLTERSECIQETEAMRVQNTELKMLLNQYLGSKVNQELHVPPTLTIPSLAQAMAAAEPQE